MKRGTARMVVKDVKRPASELLFEEYLRSQDLPFEHEPSIPGRRIRPDYRVSFSGGDVFCEVKELHARRPPPAGATHVDPYGGIRKEIHEARRQFREYRDSCCVLILYNVDDWEFRGWPDVLFGAMLGDAGVLMPFDAESGAALKEQSQPAFLGRGNMIDPKRGTRQNTTFSAIAVLSEFSIPNPQFYMKQSAREAERTSQLHRELNAEEVFEIGWRLLEEGTPARLGTCPRVVVFENPLARLPLPGGIFQGDFDERHRFSAVPGRIERVYAGHRLKEAERITSDKPDVAQELLRFIQEIIEHFHPDQIVLFGSHAHGSAEPGSDVDLLVVVPGGGDASRMSLEIRKRLTFAFPLDLVTFSAGQTQRRFDLGDPFIREVLEHGVTLYKREPRMPPMR